MTIKYIESTLENPIFYAILAIFLAIYGPRLHPRLPKNIRNLFNMSWFRVLIILLIVFLSSHDLKLSLLVSLAFLLILMMSDASDIKENFKIQMNKNKKENESATMLIRKTS
jgi:hypothetical protein